MVYSDKLEMYIARIVQRQLDTRYHERHALVTSYDPKTYRAKVRYMPSGQTSGWLPIETGHSGHGYGIAIGLQPGDGEKTGDQVVVRFREHMECGTIVQRLHSDVDKPPEVKSGEMCFYTNPQNGKGGHQIFFHDDGRLTFDSGIPPVQDQPAQNTISAPEDTPQQPPTTQTAQQPSQTQTKRVTVTMDAQGNHSINAQNNIAEQAKQQITNDAGQSQTITAPTVNTVGNTHLGTKQGQLLSMFGTLDTAGHMDIPPSATKVFAT